MSDLSTQTVDETARLAGQLRELLHDILAELDSEALQVWRASKSPVQREEQWMQVQAIAALRYRIEARIDAPKLAPAVRKKPMTY